MPAFVVYSVKKLQPSWCLGAPSGTGWVGKENGSMEQGIFTYYIRHFLAHLPPGYVTDKPTILLIDNHTSRISAEALELAASKNVWIF